MTFESEALLPCLGALVLELPVLFPSIPLAVQGAIATALVLLAFGLLAVRGGVSSQQAPRGAARPAEAPWPRRVSVVIPAYDEAEHIERAIRSVRAQDVSAEIIVVENGSRDGTAAIARRHADLVLEHSERLGYSRARNVGAARASGDLLVFLDADSRMLPHALDRIVARVEPGDFGTVRGVPDPPALRYRIFMGIKYVWQRLGLYRGVLGGLLFCDAQLFRRFGGFDEGLTIDELRRFTHDASRVGGRYSIVSSAIASTSMRRFARVGFTSSLRFWIRLRLGLEDGVAYLHLRHACVPAAEQPIAAEIPTRAGTGPAATPAAESCDACTESPARDARIPGDRVDVLNAPPVDAAQKTASTGALAALLVIGLGEPQPSPGDTPSTALRSSRSRSHPAATRR